MHTFIHDTATHRWTPTPRTLSVWLTLCSTRQPSSSCSLPLSSTIAQRRRKLCSFRFIFSVFVRSFESLPLPSLMPHRCHTHTHTSKRNCPFVLCILVRAIRAAMSSPIIIIMAERYSHFLSSNQYIVSYCLCVSLVSPAGTRQFVRRAHHSPLTRPAKLLLSSTIYFWAEIQQTREHTHLIRVRYCVQHISLYLLYLHILYKISISPHQS